VLSGEVEITNLARSRQQLLRDIHIPESEWSGVKNQRLAARPALRHRHVNDLP
jgi:hypothetical protein